MRAFSQLLDDLIYTRSRNTKLKLIGDYLKETPDPDRGYGLAALTGTLDIPHVKPAAIRGLVEERIDPVLFYMSRDYVGDTAETSTDTEKAFGKAFAAQFGNIALIVFLVVGAAFVTILMIVGNTMALSIRERTREIGVLKTLGFSGPRILAMVLGESVLLALLGGVPGLAIAALVAAALRNSLANVAPAFAVSPAIALQGLALMIALGLITGIIPALNAMRLKIATALGRG